MEELSEYIRLSKNTDRDLFVQRASRQSESIIKQKSEFNPDSHGVGLELEYYLVNPDNKLARRPDGICERAGCQHELGLHNVEIACTPLTSGGKFEALNAEIADKVRRIQNEIGDLRIQRDGCVSTEPSKIDIKSYLRESQDLDGYSVPINMTKSPYYAMLDYDLKTGSHRFEHDEIEFISDGLMPISLTSSVQPHVQVPEVDDIPTYFASALRVCGPILSISVNSPFLPPKLYDSEPSTDPYCHEHRIHIQKQVFEKNGRRGMRFPRDVESFEEIVNRISEHDLYMPLLSEDAPETDWGGKSYEFNHQQRTCWWWVNPRVGDSVNGESKAFRIEMRPFPTQPTLKDNLSLFAVCVGSIIGVSETNHPCLDLSWEDAKDNFNEARFNGSNGDIKWITKSGHETTSQELMLNDICDVARRGLQMLNIPQETAENLVDNIRNRNGRSPSDWKIERYRQNLDTTDSYTEALEETFDSYTRKSRNNQTFYSW